MNLSTNVAAFFFVNFVLDCSIITGWAKKTRPLLNVDNFTMVSGRKACDMSKVYKICLEKSKLA